MTRQGQGFVTLAVVLAAGCADGPESAPPTAAVRDSAGIVVVENRRGPADVEGPLGVEPDPVFRIGGLDAPSDRQVHQVRGGLILADGSVALFDGSSQEVRVFAADGSPRARWGGEGEGPGEFSGGALLGTRPGDTLVVWDATLRRLSLVDPAEGFVRSVTAESDAGGFPVGLGMLGTDWAVFGGGLFFSSDQGFPEGRFRSDSDYRTLHVGGEAGPPIGSFPGPEMFARVEGGGFSARSLPFGLRTVAAAADSLVWIATGERWELRGWAPGGTLRRIVRAPADPEPVTDGLIDTWIEAQLADVDPGDQATQRRALLDLPTGEHVPPFSDLVAGPGGELWARDGDRPGTASTGWTVIDGAGTLTARLDLPTRWRILAVYRDRILVVDRDELDVEQVRIHRLTGRD